MKEKKLKNIISNSLPKLKKYFNFNVFIIYTTNILQSKRTWWMRKFLWYFGSQKSELSEHIGYAGQYRQMPQFMENANKLFKFFGYKPEDFEDKFVLDVGAGSKLKSRYFNKAKIIAIEPLADKFIDNLEWSDLNYAYKVYSKPAEYLIEDLKNKVDFALSINVLDHVYSPHISLKNIYEYLKKDGEFFLSVDLHDKVSHIGHPIATSKEKIKKMVIECGYKIVKEQIGLPYASAYGEGIAYTIICKK